MLEYIGGAGPFRRKLRVFAQILYQKANARAQLFSGSSKSIPALGVSGEQPDPFVVTRWRDDALRGLHPAFEGPGKRAHRPVASPDDTVPSEALDHVLDVRPEIVGRPAL